MANGSKTEKKGKATLGRTVERPYWVFVASIFIRALHQLGAAVFLAVFLLDSVPELPVGYLVLATVSGVLLVLTEGLRHRQILMEMSGVATLAKLMILGLAYHGWVPAVPAVVFVFILASVFSHAPKSIRHRLLF